MNDRQLRNLSWGVLGIYIYVSLMAASDGRHLIGAYLAVPTLIGIIALHVAANRKRDRQDRFWM